MQKRIGLNRQDAKKCNFATDGNQMHTDQFGMHALSWDILGRALLMVL